LIVLPLVSLVFTTIHYYNSYEFIELMSSQPMSRTRILLSEFAGVGLSLLSAFLIGVGVPVLIFSPCNRSCLIIQRLFINAGIRFPCFFCIRECERQGQGYWLCIITLVLFCPDL
jgi:hypothetical protein